MAETNQICFLAMDVDGTLTDGRIYVGNNGEMFKAFDVKDGYGIKHILREHGVIPVVITARQSDALSERCDELGINYLFQGVSEKIVALQEVIKKHSLENNECYSLKNVAYIGDDVLDLQCIQPINHAGGSTACPKDAVKEVRDVAEYISSYSGGCGAVRDYIDWLRREGRI